MNIRVFTSFSGYDSQCMALDRLHAHNPDFGYELVGWSEIDKYAIAAHNAVYPQWADRNYGDISKIDWEQVPDFDLFTYSSPCQDFSQAGKQAGGTEGSGTRSSLLWECRRAILAKKPKYLLMENVAALVSQKFIRLFNAWQLELERYGYRNFAKVLNAKDYGVPQNRERIFMVSVLDEQARYEFPDPMPLQLRLKDVLEPNVDERYYLKEDISKHFDEHKERNAAKGNGFGWHPTEGDVVGNAVLTGSMRPADNYIKEPIVLGRVRDEKGNVVKRPPVEVANTVTSGKRDNTQNYVVEPFIVAQRGREPQVMTPKRTEYGKQIRKQYESHEVTEKRKNIQQLEPRTDGVSNTLTGVQKDNYVCEPSYRIRKLTERECFRVMDVSEPDIDTIQAAGISKTQQYKMAGNSIVVACLYEIFNRLFIDTEPTELTLF
jgi:DNA (cytosine-5)-methyltransferase 1